MNVGGDAADELVKEAIYFTSEAAKLAGLGIKNLAALLWAMAKDHERSPGRTKIANLLANTQHPRVVKINPEDRPAFEKLAKESGINFSPPILNRKGKDGMLNYIFAGEGIEQMNLVLEQLGYHQVLESPSKNGQDRDAPSGRNSSERGRTDDTATSTKGEADKKYGAYGPPDGYTGGAPDKAAGGKAGESVGEKFAFFMHQSKTGGAKPGKGMEMSR